jgi:RNA polymerase sigma-70 factor (ECF subfamily)
LSELPDNIWTLVQEGDLKSFELVYHRFYKALCFYSFHITKNRELSEELVNDLFLKLWTNRNITIIKGSVKGYLFQATHNLSLNLVKSLLTNKSTLSEKITESHWKFIEETYVINDFLLENIVAEETKNKIENAVKSLPEQCREIFTLSRFQNKTNQEISKHLNITEETVRVQIFRALHKIKDQLEK